MGRRLASAAIACALWSALGGRPAAADWQVHRQSSTALLDAAVAELWRRPDDAALARRAAQLAGRRGAAALRERLRARATAAQDYGSAAAYAQVLTAQGDARAAAEAFAEALRRKPGSPAALAGRARALAKAGDVPGAARTYDEALAGEHRPAARRKLVEAALALLAPEPQGDELERAIALRTDLARLEPDSDRAAEALASLLERAGRPADAATVLEARIPARQAPDKLALALHAARLRAAAADPPGAARAAASLAALLREVPARDALRRRQIWSAARDVARARGALSDLAEELARDPGPVEWDLLGQVREELGDLESALAATRKAHALAPRDAAVGHRLIALLDRLGRRQDALTAYQELVARLPGDIDLVTELADRQWQAGDKNAAGATFDRGLAHFAGQPAALERLAELASRWRDDRRAIRAWTMLARYEPDSDVAVVGLGEAQFQAGDRAGARRTWAALRARGGSPAAGHLRVGEVLLDHDLTSDAREEALAALAADPNGTGPHRLLARVAERQHQIDTAVAEWEKVLGASARGQGSELAGARHEARSHLLTLMARLGPGKLDAKIRELRDRTRAHPDDVESALFLAEAQQRAGDVDGAVATLRGIAGGGQPAGAAGEAEVEAGFALVRLLKRQGRLAEAQDRLQALARALPGRAREAELQSAELALARTDRDGALAHARAAAAGGDVDPPTLVRIGEIREQAGDDAGAITAYRAALGGDAPPGAALGLSRLLERRGDAGGAAAALDDLLRASRDDASVGDASRRALSLDELLGRLPALAETLARSDADGARAPARRHALIDVMGRLPFPRPGHDAERAAWTRLGRLALRPLLDILSADDDLPDKQVIELLGRLGNGDAAPALARIAARALEKGTARDAHRAGFAARDASLAALLALARLGDARGLDVLRRAAEDPSPSLRRLGLYGLGRIADPRAEQALWRALDDPQIELQALGCLGLSRHPGARTAGALARLAQDPGRASLVRRAAITGLGRVGAPGVDVLLAIADGGDAELAGAAVIALGVTGDPRVPAALLARALLPGRQGALEPELAVVGLNVWTEGAETREEAVLAGSLSVFDLIAAGDSAPTPPDPTAAWRARLPDIGRLLGEALAAGHEARRAALRALDSRADEPGLGALAPAGEEPLAPETATAIREIAAPLADGVAGCLDDPDRTVRAAALSVLAKLGDARVTPALVAAAVSDGDADLAEAAVTAARLAVRARPGSAAALAAAVAPALREDAGSWQTRLAAIRVLAELGRPALGALTAAQGDRHALVRAAAQAATERARAMTGG